MSFNMTKIRGLEKKHSHKTKQVLVRSSDLVKNYKNILKDLKEKIRQARLRASLSVNTQLLSLYWEIGNTILQQQKQQGWGAKIIDRLASDLRVEFSDMQGISPRNLKYMRAFAEAYPTFSIVQAPLAQLQEPKTVNKNQKAILQAPLAKLPTEPIVQAPLAQLSWYHHITLLDKVKSIDERVFYIQKTIEMGWSRNVMVHQIESNLYKRQGKIINNFQNTIAPQNSDLIKQIFKDPYKFEFIYLGKEASERDLEDALTEQIIKFLLELGQWWAFMGRQYKIMLGEKENSFDLLFYHTRLKRYIVIDLKMDEFKPEYAGKMNYYLAIADDYLKSDGDEKSIGLILCKTKEGLVAEYALRDIKNPIGIAQYKINEMLPANIKGELPSIKEIEQHIDEELKQLEKPVDKKLNRLKELISGLKNEEAKEKRNPENILRIFTKVLLPLKKQLITALTNTSKMFDETEVMIYAETQGHYTDKAARDYVAKNKHCKEFRIKITFKGFKKAHTKAFNCYKEIYIVLDENKYLFATSRNHKDKLLEKLYHHLPSKLELKSVIENYCETLLDKITQQVKRTKGKNK